MGEVYQARDTKLDRNVALKVFGWFSEARIAHARQDTGAAPRLRGSASETPSTRQKAAGALLGEGGAEQVA